MHDDHTVEQQDQPRPRKRWERPVVMPLTQSGDGAGAFCGPGSAAAACWDGASAPSECMGGAAN
jgi:hypothetical protein